MKLGKGQTQKLMDVRIFPKKDPPPSGTEPVPPHLAVSGDEEAEGLDLAEYWRIVRRHKWGILSIALLCTLVGLVTALVSRPIYQAQVRLLAEPIQPNFNPNDQAGAGQLVWLFYQTQFELIQSRAVAERVVDKLGLVAESAAKAQREKQQGQAQTSLFSFNWRDWLPEGWVAKPAGSPSPGAIRNSLAAGIQAGLDVKGGDKSEVIRVSYDSPDPNKAAEIVNAVADAYIEFGLSSRLSSAEQTTSWLNEQLVELRQKVDASEAALEAYQRTHGVINTSSQQELLNAKLASLTSEQVKAQAARAEAEIRYKQAMAVKRGTADYASLGSVLQSPMIISLRSQQNDLQRKVSELSGRYGDKHPKMIAARSDLREATRALKQATDKVIEGIRKEYELSVSREHEVNALVTAQRKEATSVTGQGFEQAKLEREVEDNRKLYDSFLSRFKEMGATQGYDVSNIRIIDRALVPTIPYKPHKTRIVMIGGLLGLLLGIGFAVLRERLDNTFRTLEQLEDKLALPVLGVMPLLKGPQAPPEVYAAKEPRSAFAESINHIRTGILFSDIDHPPKVIMVSSAQAGEGKTTLATNLAHAFSQLGRTALIEADLRKPRFSKLFPLKGQPGIVDLVAGQAAAKESVTPLKESPSLYVFGTGTRPPNPLEFLSSHSFEKVVKALAARFEHVVIDAAPILPVSDAIVLSRVCDAMLICIQAESTTHQMANATLRRLVNSNIQPLGVVLTMADAKRMSYYGGHYYHYYADYAYYGDQGEEEATAKASG